MQWWRGDTRKPERQAARPLELDRVRQEILARAAVHPPSPAVAALERLFAGTVSVLLGSDPSLQWQAALHPYDFSTERLKAHAYQTWVGERLAGLRAALDDDAPAVADFWQAAQEFARWLVETLDAAREQGGLVFDGRRGRWLTEIATVATDFCRTARYLESPGGTAIAVFGIPQTMWRKPDGMWCLLEYGALPATIESDRLLAVLYHDLAAAGLAEVPGAIELVRFGGAVTTRRFETADLEAGRGDLAALLRELGAAGAREAAPQGLETGGATSLRAEANRRRDIERVLRDSGTPGRVIAGPLPAPGLVRYRVIPENDVRLSSLLRLGQELQARLNLSQEPAMRVEADAVAIDLQTESPAAIAPSALEQLLPAGSPVLIPAGVAPGGRLVALDLERHTHVLLAGKEGSGKSEWLRTAVTGLVLRNTPETLRLVLLDPKAGVFAEFAGSPFVEFPGALCQGREEAADALELLVEEMEDRESLFASIGAGTLREYCEVTAERKPRLVCVCDDYGHLFHTEAERREVDGLLVRLGSRARAAGIHLIFAATEPGAALQSIAAARFALPVEGESISQRVLSEAGAELLSTPGALLYRSDAGAVRLQTLLLDVAECRRLFAPPGVAAGAVSH